VLLARGDIRGALARFDAAAAQGPRFADAIEGRGEVLLAEGDAAAAARAFQAASKFAPAWGRLHLKWAEALARLGQRDQARAELRQAGQLDLTAAERTERGAQKV
jgi:tetratricopeptide (TPR) repeat protein